MYTSRQLKKQINDGGYDAVFERLYPNRGVEESRTYYTEAVTQFELLFGTQRKCALVSAPGRTEICGNHTDHQKGRVFAAAVDLDVVCVVSENQSNTITVHSRGFSAETITIDDLEKQPKEKGKASALIRGVAQWFSHHGYTVCGFDAYTISSVIEGSGVSSSAAFETAIGNMLNVIGNNDATAVEIAKAGKYAENVHFGKPSGLMDQMASSVGSAIYIDFLNEEDPKIRTYSVGDLLKDYELCVVNTRGSHADLTEDYSEITTEMRQIANYFNEEYLSRVNEQEFYDEISQLREAAGDRSVLRALHFFEENKRVGELAQAIEQHDTKAFLQILRNSGASSFTCLQNVFSTRYVKEQGLSLALALSELVLKEEGAFRVHGGGFAGTIQAFVPKDKLDMFVKTMDNAFGEGSCIRLAIRPVGGVHVTRSLKIN